MFHEAGAILSSEVGRVNRIRARCRRRLLTGGTGFWAATSRALSATRDGACACSRGTRLALGGTSSRAGSSRSCGRPLGGGASGRGAARLPTRSSTSRDSRRRGRSRTIARSTSRGTERLSRAAPRRRPGARCSCSCRARPRPVPRSGGRPVDDADPARPVSWYGRSKLEGEEAVARRWPGPWIVLRPGVVYGPGDRGLLRTSGGRARDGSRSRRGRRGSSSSTPRARRSAIARAAGRPDLAGPPVVSVRPRADLDRRARPGDRVLCSGRRPGSSAFPPARFARWRPRRDARRDADAPLPAVQRRQGPGDPRGRLALRGGSAVGRDLELLPARSRSRRPSGPPGTGTPQRVA